MRRVAVAIEWLIYNARFGLVGLYAVVAAALLGFVFIACREAVRFFSHVWELDLEEATINMLALVDSMMVANLIWFITQGSYMMYVKPRLFDEVSISDENRPQALRGLTPGLLKERMAGSLITISAVNLIRVLLENQEVSWKILTMKAGLHLLFILGFVVFLLAGKHEEAHHEEKATQHAH